MKQHTVIATTGKAHVSASQSGNRHESACGHVEHSPMIKKVSRAADLPPTWQIDMCGPCRVAAGI